MENIEQYRQWLAWVYNRLRTLDVIDTKLHKMRQLTLQVQESPLSQQELEAVNQKFNLLEQEVNRLDEQSRNYITH